MKCMTKNRDCRHWGLGRCLAIGAMAVVGVALVAGLVMGLWNALVPEIFPGVAVIGYWQALGLLALCRILFGGMRGGCHGRWRRHHGHREGWENLSEEEREELKGRFRGRWGRCAPEAVETPAVGDKP